MEQHLEHVAHQFDRRYGAGGGNAVDVEARVLAPVERAGLIVLRDAHESIGLMNAFEGFADRVPV